MSETKPWLAIGMSRASWYRHGRPTTKPKPRVTNRQIAEELGVSLRTVERDLADMRERDRQKTIARVQEYMAQGYSQDEAGALRAAELRAIAIEKLIEQGRLVTFAAAGWLKHPRASLPRPSDWVRAAVRKCAFNDPAMTTERLYQRLWNRVDDGG